MNNKSEKSLSSEPISSILTTVSAKLTTKNFNITDRTIVYRGAEEGFAAFVTKCQELLAVLAPNITPLVGRADDVNIDGGEYTGIKIVYEPTTYNDPSMIGRVISLDGYCNIPKKSRIKPPHFDNLQALMADDAVGAVAISGISGSGKTELAYYYAEINANIYAIRHKLNSENETHLFQNLITLYGMLKGSDAKRELLLDNSLQDILQKTEFLLPLVREGLNQLAKSQKILLILDNVPPNTGEIYKKTIEMLSGYAILIILTQNDLYARSHEGCKQFSLNTGWDETAAIKFFDRNKLQHLPTETPEINASLKVLVSYIKFPLGLSIAAKTVNQQCNPSLGLPYSYQEYYDDIRSGMAENLEVDVVENKSWEIIQEAVIRKALDILKVDVDINDFLVFAAHLASEHIFFELFESYYRNKKTTPLENRRLKNKVRQFIEQIQKYSLLLEENEESSYQMHRYVQDVSLRHLPLQEEQQILILQTFQHYFLDDVISLFGQMPGEKLNILVNHSLSVNAKLLVNMKTMDISSDSFRKNFEIFSAISTSIISVKNMTPLTIINELNNIIDQIIDLDNKIFSGKNSVPIWLSLNMIVILSNFICILDRMNSDDTIYESALIKHLENYFLCKNKMVEGCIDKVLTPGNTIEDKAAFLNALERFLCSPEISSLCTYISALASIKKKLATKYMACLYALVNKIYQKLNTRIDSNAYIESLTHIANALSKIREFDYQREIFITQVQPLLAENHYLQHANIQYQLAAGYFEERNLTSFFQCLEQASGFISSSINNTQHAIDYDLSPLYFKYSCATANRGQALFYLTKYKHYLEKSPVLMTRNIHLLACALNFRALEENMEYQEIIRTVKSSCLDNPMNNQFFLKMINNIEHMAQYIYGGKSLEDFKKLWLYFKNEIESSQILTMKDKVDQTIMLLDIALYTRKFSVLCYLAHTLQFYKNIQTLNLSDQNTLLFKFAQIIIFIYNNKIQDATNFFHDVYSQLSTIDPITIGEAYNYYRFAQITVYLGKYDIAKTMFTKSYNYLVKILQPQHLKRMEVESLKIMLEDQDWDFSDFNNYNYFNDWFDEPDENKAYRALAAGRYEEAIEHYQQVIYFGFKPERVYHNYAVAYQLLAAQTKNIEYANKANDLFKKAIMYNKTLDVQIEYANFLRFRGNYIEALDMLNSLLRAYSIFDSNGGLNYSQGEVLNLPEAFANKVLESSVPIEIPQPIFFAAYLKIHCLFAVKPIQKNEIKEAFEQLSGFVMQFKKDNLSEFLPIYDWFLENIKQIVDEEENIITDQIVENSGYKL